MSDTSVQDAPQDPEAVPPTPDDTIPGPVDYFACDETYEVVLPDNVQTLTCKTLNEGDRKRYQSRINRDMTIKKGTGDAQIKLSQGEERHELIIAAVIDWTVLRGGKPVPFSKGSAGANLEQFLNAAPPKIVDHIFKAISKKETWLNADVTVEDIDEQIRELEELRAEKLLEEAGKGI